MPGVETAVNSVLHPNARRSGVDRPRPVDRVIYQLNWSGPEACYGVHNNSVRNLARGINERIFYRDNKGTVCVQPQPGGFGNLEPFLNDLRTFRVEPWSIDRVVESYTGKKRAVYERARESLMYLPLNAKDARLKTFVKAEKIDFASKADPAPRVIQPRDPRFNLHFAKYMKPLEAVLYKQMAKLYTSPCVAKGFNASQTGELIHSKWIQFSKPVAISLDASRFDQHVSVPALKWTHQVYRRFVRGSDLEWCLGKMYCNRGIGVAKDGVVRYKKMGGRCSGDMDTALGNCVLMVAMVYSLCKRLNIRHEVIDNGDDITVFMEDGDRALFMSKVKGWFTDLGFDIKVESTSHCLEQVEFCQTRPVCRDGKYVMVRNLVALAKDTTTLLDVRQTAHWWDAIGVCGAHLTDGIPVYSEFYRWLRSVGQASNAHLHPLYECGMTMMAKGMEYADREVSDRTRDSFASAFGISVERQLLLEDEIRNLGKPAPDIRKFEIDELKKLSSNYLTATWEHGTTTAFETPPQAWCFEYGQE